MIHDGINIYCISLEYRPTQLVCLFSGYPFWGVVLKGINMKTNFAVFLLAFLSWGGVEGVDPRFDCLNCQPQSGV